MFNVNPSRMYRNKLKKGPKSHRRHSKRSPLRMKVLKALGNMRVSLKLKNKPTRKIVTRKASRKRREKSLMKRRHFGLNLNRQVGIPLDKIMKPKTNILAKKSDGKQAKD